jgi:hypothetical protein
MCCYKSLHNLALVCGKPLWGRLACLALLVACNTQLCSSAQQSMQHAHSIAQQSMQHAHSIAQQSMQCAHTIAQQSMQHGYSISLQVGLRTHKLSQESDGRTSPEQLRMQ